MNANNDYHKITIHQMPGGVREAGEKVGGGGGGVLYNKEGGFVNNEDGISGSLKNEIVDNEKDPDLKSKLLNLHGEKRKDKNRFKFNTYQEIHHWQAPSPIISTTTIITHIQRFSSKQLVDEEVFYRHNGQEINGDFFYVIIRDVRSGRLSGFVRVGVDVKAVNNKKPLMEVNKGLRAFIGWCFVVIYNFYL